MKIDLRKDEPKLLLGAVDINVLDKYVKMLTKIGKHVPELKEKADESLLALAEVVKHCDLSPTAPNKSLFGE